MKLDCVFYYVSDLDRAVDFYERTLGLALESRDFVARFRVDGLLFELVPAADLPAGGGAGNARVVFEVPEIDAGVAELRRKGVPVGPVERVGNGALAHFRDPDGNDLLLWQYADRPGGTPA